MGFLNQHKLHAFDSTTEVSVEEASDGGKGDLVLFVGRRFRVADIVVY